MDFMEQIKQTATDVAQSVAQKSNELVERSKIKYELHELTGDVKKLYEEIGKLVYEDLRTEALLTEDIQIKCEIIEAKLARIEVLRKKEKQLVKRGITCPSCGNECGEDVNFCPKCGAELAVTVTGEAETPETEAAPEEPENPEAQP